MLATKSSEAWINSQSDAGSVKKRYSKYSFEPPKLCFFTPPCPCHRSLFEKISTSSTRFDAAFALYKLLNNRRKQDFHGHSQLASRNYQAVAS